MKPRSPISVRRLALGSGIATPVMDKVAKIGVALWNCVLGITKEFCELLVVSVKPASKTCANNIWVLLYCPSKAGMFAGVPLIVSVMKPLGIGVFGSQLLKPFKRRL